MKKLFSLSEKKHGPGAVIFSWQPSGSFLATAGSNGIVHIFDRNGNQVDEVALNKPTPCLHLAWDKDGENLAILQEKNPDVPIWTLSSRRLNVVRTELSDLTFIKWSPTSPLLAVGTAKGNLLIYQSDMKRKIPIMGKHTKAITCGAWSNSNVLALASDDSTLTLSKPNGDTIEHSQLKTRGVAMQFARSKPQSRAEKIEGKHSEQNNDLVSINMDGDAILLYHLKGAAEPVELKFQRRYGEIVCYEWFGEGYMIVGFSEGFVVIISTHAEDIGQEIASWPLFENNLHGLNFSQSMRRAACVGDDHLKLLEHTGKEWRLMENETVKFDRRKDGQVDKVHWTLDGQILTVSTLLGRIYSYIAAMPVLNDHCENRVAFLSSLQEVSVTNVVDKKKPTVNILEVEVEPSFISLGPRHLAVGMNNRVWFYNCAGMKEAYDLNNEEEYLGTVTNVYLSESVAAVLYDGQIKVHDIEQGRNSREPQLLPMKKDKATCAKMTHEFLVYGCTSGALHFFSTTDWEPLPGCEYRHDCAIYAVYPNDIGTRVVFIDSADRVFLYNGADTSIIEIADIGATVTRVMWDSIDECVFVVATDDTLFTYVYSEFTVWGPRATRVGPSKFNKEGELEVSMGGTRVPDSFSPILVRNGVITGQFKNGTIDKITLRTHTDADVRSIRKSDNKKGLPICFAQNLTLLRLKPAWSIASMDGDENLWRCLSEKALEVLNLEMAIKVYRHLGDAGMVLTLEEFAHIEDRFLLSGYVHMLFSRFDEAEDCLLKSSKPIVALEMRTDLLQWENAIKLAEALAPERLPTISIKYGQQCEHRGMWQKALQNYQNARAAEDKLTEEERAAIFEGIAKTNLRLGDVRRGREMAIESGNKQLCADCAKILAAMKTMNNDAAQLYIKAEDYEAAASIYIQDKKFDLAQPLMTKITTPKLHIEYAHAKEDTGDYVEAVRSYERAGDLDNVVRLNLYHLDREQTAFSIVRENHSAKGAQMIAEYCRSRGKTAGAIEFLLMSKRAEEAFEEASSHDAVDVYVNVLGKNGSPEQYIQIARYYERKKDWGNAGRFHAICGQYSKALNYFLMCGENEMTAAIDVVGKARSTVMTNTLIDFLMGDTDNVPKDPHYIFQLYMALGNYVQASNTAIIIARQEQDSGNYTTAHRMLYDTYKDLQDQRIRIPQVLAQALLLVHSYLMAKQWVKIGDHELASRLLTRVAKNVSKFPNNKVGILTSAVIECKRAHRDATAYTYAAQLMQKDMRESINEKYRRSIEKLVRKRPKKKDADEATTPCPHCWAQVPNSSLKCDGCKNRIPYCIISGMHMIFNDWSFCPGCRFPAKHSVITMYVEKAKPECPLCSHRIMPGTLSKVKDPKPQLTAYMQHFEETPADEENKTADGDAGDSAEKEK
eukprot:INCI18667.1.p1 GENE.INCI18667.1~~INCI18667.1.p1  ORF type:complete len:1397 (-),score=234.22 INCI18667.1:122-4312(-)